MEGGFKWDSSIEQLPSFLVGQVGAGEVRRRTGFDGREMAVCRWKGVGGSWLQGSEAQGT